MPPIRNRQIHRELRLAGCIIRLGPKKMSPRMLRLCNRFLDTFAAGHALTRQSLYRQMWIERPDGTKLRLAIYAPKKTQKDMAGMLWIHGGGYAIGVPEIDVHFANMLTELGCLVVAPDYTRSTRAPYPAAFDDCCLALRWLRDHAAELNVSSEQLFVGGDSAGGGLAAAVCLHARDKGDVAIAAQFPLYPMLDDRPTATNADNDAPVWNTASNIPAWEMYLRGLKEEIPAYAAPARCADMSGMPPAMSFVGDIDPFLAETTAYMEALQKAGVETSFQVFDGCFHGFDILFGWTKVGKHARLLFRNSVAYARKYFRKPQPEGEQT